jgi:uncharacterized protein
MISRRKFLKWLMALGVVGVAAPAYGIAVEPFRTRVTRYTLTPKRWSDGLNLTIAVIADLHACRPWMTPERIAAIVEQTNSLKPDVILLLGDYISALKLVTDDVSPEEWSAQLAKLSAPLGVHAVLGNHDWWHDDAAQKAGRGPTIARRALEAVGIPVYENDAVRLIKNGRPFWLAGLGDQIAWWPRRGLQPGTSAGVDDLGGMLAKITDNAPVILMAHEPDVMPRVPDRVSLMFSGHTHGGQVRLLGWSPVVPSRYKNRYAYGHIREQCDLIVSGGLGMSIFPLRFGIPPEIVLVNVGNAGNPAT